MSGALQTLVECPERSTPGSSEPGPSRRPIDLPSQGVRDANEGFKGDSPFDTHAASMANAMQTRGSPFHDSAGLQVLRGWPTLNSSIASDAHSANISSGLGRAALTPGQVHFHSPSITPPQETAPFYDVLIIGEQEFVWLSASRQSRILCRHGSLSTWAYTMPSTAYRIAIIISLV